MKNVFVIVNYNDYENTSKLILNIKNYKVIDEILVIDNCSKDESFHKLNKIKLKKIKVIRTDKNNGYGSAINVAAKYCEEKYNNCNLIVSNSDIIIKDEKDLIDLIKEINDRNCAVVAPLINQKGIHSMGWKIPNVFDEIIMSIPKINKIYENRIIKYNPNYFHSRIKEVEVVSGCFFIIRLKSLKNINYFDENIFLYYEENTISYKLKQLNEKIFLNPNIEIIHNHSLTINKNINEYNKLKELKKSQYYFYKNVKKSNKIGLMILKKINKIVLKAKK